jgi:hypothetical protein
MARHIFYSNFFSCLALLIPLWSSSAVSQTDEYTMKAAYIEHFTRFIEWPQSPDLEDLSKPFILGIIGNNRLGRTCEDYYSNNKIKGKKVEIRHVATPAEIAHCNLLYIGSLTASELDQVLSRTKNLPILTVGDSKGFCEKGVLINFYLENHMVRFEINQKAAVTSGLSFSFHLLRLARIVGQTTDRP